MLNGCLVIIDALCEGRRLLRCKRRVLFKVEVFHIRQRAISIGVAARLGGQGVGRVGVTCFLRERQSFAVCVRRPSSVTPVSFLRAAAPTRHVRGGSSVARGVKGRTSPREFRRMPKHTSNIIALPSHLNAPHLDARGQRVRHEHGEGAFHGGGREKAEKTRTRFFLKKNAQKKRSCLGETLARSHSRRLFSNDLFFTSHELQLCGRVHPLASTLTHTPAALFKANKKKKENGKSRSTAFSFIPPSSLSPPSTLIIFLFNNAQAPSPCSRQPQSRPQIYHPHPRSHTSRTPRATARLTQTPSPPVSPST